MIDTIDVAERVGVVKKSVEESFTTCGTAEARYPVFTIPFSFKFVVVCKFLI